MCQVRLAPGREPAAPVNDALENVEDVPETVEFGSRKQWNFKSGETKFFSSKVVDRKRAEVWRLAFMNS